MKFLNFTLNLSAVFYESRVTVKQFTYIFGRNYGELIDGKNV